MRELFELAGMAGRIKVGPSRAMESVALTEPDSAAAGPRIRTVPAVKRAAAILKHLSRHADGLTVTRLASDLDIIPSTCLHILRELMAAHLVAFEANGKIYKLGFGILALAKELRFHEPFIHAAQPRLEAFAREHGVSVSAQQRDGEESVVLAAVTASEGLEAPLGIRVPVLSSASGQVFAANSGWTRAQMASRFARVRWQMKPDFETWLQHVDEARQRGYAIDDGNFRVGITAVSVAVAGRGPEVVRTISINVVSAQLDAKRASRLLNSLLRTASEVAAALQAE